MIEQVWTIWIPNDFIIWIPTVFDNLISDTPVPEELLKTIRDLCQ